MFPDDDLSAPLAAVAGSLPTPANDWATSNEDDWHDPPRSGWADDADDLGDLESEFDFADMPEADAALEVGTEPHDVHATSPDESKDTSAATLEPSTDSRVGVVAALNTPRLRSRLGTTALLIFLAMLYRWCRTLQESGHDWGDDFSLYLRQGKALIQGYPQRVVNDTYFAVSNSGWQFSPFAYPWGWPIILAPFVAVWGLNYTKLKIVVTLLLLAFLFGYHRLVRRRTGELVALLLVMVMGSNFFLESWTNNILSEFPYMAALVLALLCLDRYRRLGAHRNTNLWPAITAGLAMAWAANIRREGLGLPVGLVVMQFVESVAWWRESRASRPRLAHLIRNKLTLEQTTWVRRTLWRMAVPYVTVVGAIGAFQLLVPSDLLPALGESKLKNVSGNYHWYRGILAELFGFKDPGDVPLRFVHDGHVVVPLLNVSLPANLGDSLFHIAVAGAVIGLIGRLILAPRRDAWLAATVAGPAYVVMVAPYHDGRYLYSIYPWILYFLAQAVPVVGLLFQRARSLAANEIRSDADPSPAGPTGAVAVVEHAKSVEALRWPTRVVSAAFLALLVASNIPQTQHALQYHRGYSYIENGPDKPESKEMFDAVKRLTRPDDVILFFRARALMLYTDRRAVENTDLARMRTIADYYVMEANSDYGQTLIRPGEESRYAVAKVWANARFTLWKFLEPPVVPVATTAPAPTPTPTPKPAAVPIVVSPATTPTPAA